MIAMPVIAVVVADRSDSTTNESGLEQPAVASNVAASAAAGKDLEDIHVPVGGVRRAVVVGVEVPEDDDGDGSNDGPDREPEPGLAIERLGLGQRLPLRRSLGQLEGRPGRG